MNIENCDPSVNGNPSERPRIDNTQVTQQRRLPGTWIRDVPVAALEELSDVEFKAWCVLRTRCMKSDHCFIKIDTFAADLRKGYTQAWSLIQALKKKRWLTTKNGARSLISTHLSHHLFGKVKRLANPSEN